MKPPTSNALDPAHEVYNNTASSSSSTADLNQLLFPHPSPGLEGPGLPRPAYPSQINDLDPLTQDAQSASVGHHQPEPNPSLNSYPEPWSQQLVNGGHFQYHMGRSYSGAWPRTSYPLAKPQYWPQSNSEMDCSVSGRYPPDSAYYTKSPATQSIFSGEFPDSSQPSLTGAMNTMEVPSEQMTCIVYPTAGLSAVSQEAQASSMEHQTEDAPEYICEVCGPGLKFKNKSEHRYFQPKPWT